MSSSTLDSRRQLLKTLKQRNYLVKEFDDFYRDLQDYARTYYPTKFGKDTSENSMGGALLEFVARVGDVQSYYLDHQFHETSPSTAVEVKNIERHLKDNGVIIVGSSPAVVTQTFYARVPVQVGSNPPVPDPDALPIFFSGTTVRAINGVLFELVEDADFSERDAGGKLKADIMIGDKNDSNFPTNFIMSRKGLCVSGQRQVDTFDVGAFSKFKIFTLSKENVTDIISVRDTLGNTYYEVGFLTQDVVFQGLLNKNEDNELVKENMEIIPAPYRFVKQMDLGTRLTSLTFGGGNAQSLNDDIIPDPSEFAVPLYGKRTFSRFALNPANLLQTTTLGIIAPNTTITVEYRYGGGLNHNVGPRGIRNINTLRFGFAGSPSSTVAAFVRESFDSINEAEAGGGSDPPSIDELKQLIPASRNAQERDVTKQDMLARIYTLPSNFGRVFRASIRSNPNNPLAARIYVACRNANKELTIAPDALKKNLALYLNQYRLISDAADILDAQVINLQLEYAVTVDPTYTNKQLVIQGINAKLKDFFSRKNFEIDEPISLSEVEALVWNNTGLLSLQYVRFKNVTGTVANRIYSDVQFDVGTNTMQKIVFGPPGSIFEIKYKDFDIAGSYI